MRSDTPASDLETLPAVQTGGPGRAWRATGVVLGLLWIAGLAHWAWFLGPAAHPLEGPRFAVEDWRKEYRYYAVLQQAVREGTVPYYISRPIHTRRFLALPEVTWSPQIVLLRYLDIGQFVVLNTLLLFTAGSVGLALLSRRMGLGPIPAALLFLVFALSGHVTAHIGVGHSMWAAYFLYPFVLIGLLDLLEERGGICLALSLFAVALQGGFHLFVFAASLAALVALFERRHLVAFVTALVWASALSACRFAPAYFLLDRKEQAFLSGFPSVGVLFDGLVAIREATSARVGGRFDALNWWEYDYYVGAVGLAWLVVFGLARPLWRRGRPPLPPALLAGAATLAALSLGDAWAPWNALPLPVVSAERVSTRFLILPFLILALAAAAQSEEWLRTTRSWFRPVGLLAVTVALGMSLLAHSRTWRVEKLESELAQRTGRLDISIAPPPEPPGSSDRGYLATVRISAGVSLLALAVPLVGRGLSRAQHRRAKSRA